MKDRNNDEKEKAEIDEIRRGPAGDRLAGLEYLISEIQRDVNLLEAEIDRAGRPQSGAGSREEIAGPEPGEELER